MSADETEAGMARSSEDASAARHLQENMAQPVQTTGVIGVSEENGSCNNSSMQLSSAKSAEAASSEASISNLVAQHYNQVEEKGLQERTQSRIFYLRNFNNWIKSMLINEYLLKIKAEVTKWRGIKVLDLGCGKGGDLLKWQRGGIGHLICADIAETSIMQAEDRYKLLQTRAQHDRHMPSVFTAEFITADCTKENLRDKYKDHNIRLDLVSCQFAFHYCFESFLQAECMLRNASECLRPGGYFIGTTTDAFDIVRRLQNCGSNSFGNDVYSISFDKMEYPPPLFGLQYNFHLDDVVDCPEFLVHFPTLVKLAQKYNLELVAKERFEDFFQKHLDEGKQLLGRMQALETYPAFDDNPLVSSKTEDYSDVVQMLHQDRQDSVESREDNRRRVKRVGTLSKSEWEAAALYIVFAFKKCRPTKKSGETDKQECSKEEN